jgi:hypothetical protein
MALLQYQNKAEYFRNVAFLLSERFHRLMFIDKANKDAREKIANRSRYRIGCTRLNCVTYIYAKTSFRCHLLRVRT